MYLRRNDLFLLLRPLGIVPLQLKMKLMLYSDHMIIVVDKKIMNEKALSKRELYVL